MENEIKIYSIRFERRLMKRSECLKEAQRILYNDLIDGMTVLQLAQEIRFHAAAYYFSVFRPVLIWVKKHADPIDLGSGGDTKFRRFFFVMSWIFTNDPAE